MTVRTRVDQAIERVATERSWTVEKRRKVEAFADDVAELEPAAAPAGGASPGASLGAGPAAGGWTATEQSAAGGVGTSAVLECFDEHLAAYSGTPDETPETVHDCVAEEFSSELAVALCGGDTSGALTPSLKRAVVEAAQSRRAELDVTATALRRERASLEDARDAIEPITGWFVEHDPTPLSDLGFERLRDWHERIDEHRAALDDVAAERQVHLDRTTTHDGAVGVDHDVLATYLYAEFEVSHPVLATVASLADCCRSAQRAIRDHLVRRV